MYSEFVFPSEITADRLHIDCMRNVLRNAMQLCFAGAEADCRLGRIPMANAVAASHDGAATRRASGRHTSGKVGVDTNIKRVWGSVKPRVLVH